MEGEKLRAEKGRSGWTRSRNAYACADGARVRLRAYVLVEGQNSQDGADGTQNGLPEQLDYQNFTRRTQSQRLQLPLETEHPPPAKRCA